MTERHAQVLAELADLGLSLARKIHTQAMAAETPEETAELGLAFHRISRSVRQTLALEAKLKRDLHRQDREDRQEAETTRKADVRRRTEQARLSVQRLIWTETEDDEDEALSLLEDLETRLDEAALTDDFLDGPVEALITRLATDLGLSAPPLQDSA